ncbi:MAG: YhbD family protein [Alicyclobacillus sp.]|nr:YhbD family protein [Alicyclobacillus sp.]
MEQDLLSKKELLELTGISYGQLYRWKRKNLIPEDWFIRKSTFTGQETFFPRDKILKRIEQIKNMKEGLSLDEMADMFSPNPADITRTYAQCKEQSIVTEVVLELYRAHHPDESRYSFDALLCMYLVDVALNSGEVNLDEGTIILKMFEEHYPKVRNKSCGLIFTRKLGMPMCMLYSTPNDVFFDSGTKIVLKLDVDTCIEELKQKLV